MKRGKNCSRRKEEKMGESKRERDELLKKRVDEMRRVTREGFKTSE